MVGLMSISFITAVCADGQQADIMAETELEKASSGLAQTQTDNNNQWISEPAKENIKFAFKAGYVCSVCPLAVPMLPITAPICIFMMGVGLSGSYNKGDGWVFPTYFAGLVAGVATWGIPLYALNKCYGWF